MDKLYYSYDNMVSDCRTIVREMAHDSYHPDVIIGPGRGAYPFGVMMSHYFEVPFEAFRWQTRDGAIEDSVTLEHELSKYKGKKILVVDDINDSGTTLIGINAVIEKFDREHNNNQLVMHQELRYSTLFSKESSNFADVDYTANEVLPDQERWIVFPYEEWWT
jgi:hypoxanthine phosphoribosyltransferase